MKIEILVYAYLAVCLAMIGFNIVCIFLFSRNDRETEQSRLYYINLIKEQFGKAVIDERHRMLILKRLVHVREMTAFDKSLEILSKEYPAEVQAYLRGLKSVFVALANRYSRRNEIQMAYFPYIIARYKLFYGEDLPQINRIMVDLLEKPSIYCRENALNAIYSMGVSENVTDALTIIDSTGYYHNKKLLTDGLMSFAGDKKELNEMLWNHRYPYQPAYEQLMKYAEREDEVRWEYTSITCFALASYPGERTIAALKKNLSSHNWYVRLNASQALESMGLEYADFIDIFEGDDRYAGEMMRYRFDRKKLSERRAAT